MPTYEYKCLKCGHRFEVFQSMKDKPVEHCPLCNGEVKRLIGSGAGTIFKGTGFYQTDYKNSSTKSESKKAEPSKSSEKKSDKNSSADK